MCQSVCVERHQIKSEKPTGNSPLSKAVGEQAVFNSSEGRGDSKIMLVAVGGKGTKVFEKLKFEKPSIESRRGTGCFFNFQKSEEVDSGGDLVVVGGKGKKQHYA